MSRKIIEGNKNIPLKNKGKEYTQAETSVDLDLVDSALEEFLLFLEAHANLKYPVPQIQSNRIREDPDLDGQAFLDAMIRKLESTTPHQQTYADRLVSSIVRELYRGGRNNFIIDYQNLTPHHHFISTGEELRGERQNPLNAVYLLDRKNSLKADQAGDRAINCSLTIHGLVDQVGFMASSSSFYLDSTPRQIGFGARDCTFYLGDVMGVTWHRQGGDYKGTMMDTEGEKHILTFSDFFEKRNRLAIPHGEMWRLCEPSDTLKLRHAGRKALRRAYHTYIIPER